jgi:two-component system, OmpR family, sensor kinase
MTTNIPAQEPLKRTDGSVFGCGWTPVADQWRLVGIASHELRTPLTALRTEVELALLGNRDASELRAALRSAADEIRRISRLADDMLVLARAGHGRLPLRLRPLDPRALIEAAGCRARAAARALGRTITVRNCALDGRLLGDPDRLAQALDNLVNNALRYGDGTITLTARNDGKMIGLHVADQGDGFAEDLLATAFQPFTCGQRSRADEHGSGLGLSLVEAIAAAHGGQATVRNLPGGGADACISLPPA